MSNRKFLSEQSNDATRRKFADMVSKLMGKSLNAYSSSPNTNQNFIHSYRIMNLRPLGTIGTKLIITVDKEGGHNRTDFTKTCGKKAFENANSVGGKERFVYSDKLNDFLEREFCTRSKGGSVVPTADFSSVETGDNSQAMTESRKVVKLKESDITRLVRKIISEQSNQPVKRKHLFK